MRSSTIFLMSLLTTTTTAQSIIPANQPTCIQQCQLFTQAQQACSPNQAVAAQYQSCFCQSAYLQPIKSNPTGNICPNCAAADWTTIASWYNGLCGAGTNAAAAPAATAGQTTLATTTTAGGIATAGTTTAGAATATTDTTVQTTGLSSAENPANWTDASSWFKSHWQWVVMIIVLAVAFTIIGVVGTIVHKKKSRARHYGMNYTAPMRSNPVVDTWAPNRHSVHDFGTPRETSPAPPMPAMTAGDSRRQSRRLGKAPSVRQ